MRERRRGPKDAISGWAQINFTTGGYAVAFMKSGTLASASSSFSG